MMTAPVQKFPRFQFHAAVELFVPSSALTANVHNISLGGMFVATPTLWRPGNRVQAVVGLPRGPLTAPCRVVHALDPQGALVKGHPVGMGLEFDALGDEARTALTTLVGALGRVTVEQPGPARANRAAVRWTDARRVHVRLSPSQDGEWWLRNISQGGMYLETLAPPARGTMLGLTLEAPGGTLELQAEVVHVVDATAAAELGHPAGVGVQFVNLARAQWDALKRYLDGVTTQLHVDVSAPLPHAPLERVVEVVRRFFAGLEAQDGFMALGLPVTATRQQVEERAQALDLILSIPPPNATPPQRARMETVRKALPRVRQAVERAVDSRPKVSPSPPVAAKPVTPPVQRAAPAEQPRPAPSKAAVDAVLEHARTQATLGDVEAALETVGDGLRAAPGDARLMQLRQELAARHREETVDGLLSSALVLAGTNGMQLQAAARAHQALSMLRTPVVMRRVLQVLLKAKDHKGVVSLARDMVSQDRNDPAAYEALLEVYDQAGHLALAVRTAETLLRLRPKDHALRSRLEKLKNRLN